MVDGEVAYTFCVCCTFGCHTSEQGKPFGVLDRRDGPSDGEIHHVSTMDDAHDLGGLV
jgi:hypothetical protein